MKRLNMMFTLGICFGMLFPSWGAEKSLERVWSRYGDVKVKSVFDQEGRLVSVQAWNRKSGAPAAVPETYLNPKASVDVKKMSGDTAKLRGSLDEMAFRMAALEDGLYNKMTSSPRPGKKSKESKAHEGWKFYGVAHLSLLNFDMGAGMESETTLDSNSSRLGFKSSKKLSNGDKVLWQLEASIKGFDGDTASDLTGRNSYLGYSSDWGTIKLGKHDTPYKFSTKKLNLYADRVGDYNGILGSYNGKISAYEERIRVLMFESKKVKDGLNFALAYSNLDQSFDLGAGDLDPEVVSWSLRYPKDDWTFFAAGESHKDGAVGTIDGDALRFGASFKKGQNKYGFIWETIEADAVGSEGSERDAWFLSFAHKRDKNTFNLAYGVADDSQAVAGKDGATHLTLGIDRKLAKGVTAYVVYSQIDNDTNARYGFSDPDSRTAGSIKPAAGEDIQAFGVGLKYKF
jgi:predicted porin